MAALRVLAARDVATERRGAAGLDGAHDLQLCVAHVAAIGITPSGTEVVEDICDLESGTLQECATLLRRVPLGVQWLQQIERAHNAAEYLGRDFGIDRGRLQLGVTEQNLNHADIHTLLEQVRCK